MQLRQKIKDAVRWDGRSEEERRSLLRKVVPVSRFLARSAGMARLDLKTIGLLSLTDKAGGHEYADAYPTYFKPYRRRKINLLEIGVGGYTHDEGGRSLVLWNAYFPKANVVGLDIHDKTHLSRGRIRVFQGSQVDRDRLEEIDRIYGGFDIIIDDGSHQNEHIVETFGILFDKLRKGGMYVIEDLQTSYWTDYGGGMPGSAAFDRSAMSFLASLVHSVNAEFIENDSDGVRVRDDIASISFYKEICFIQKK